MFALLHDIDSGKYTEQRYAIARVYFY